jgi:hypothetical protein
MFKKSITIGKDTFYVKDGYIYKNPIFDEDGNIRTYKDMVQIAFEKGRYFKSIKQHSLSEDKILILVDHTVGRMDLYDLNLKLLGYLY